MIALAARTPMHTSCITAARACALVPRSALARAVAGDRNDGRGGNCEQPLSTDLSSSYNSGGLVAKYPAAVCNLPATVEHLYHASISLHRGLTTGRHQCSGPSVALRGAAELLQIGSPIWSPHDDPSTGRMPAPDANQLWKYIPKKYRLPGQPKSITVMAEGIRIVDKEHMSAVVPSGPFLYTINIQYPGSNTSWPIYLGMSEEGRRRARDYIHQDGGFGDDKPEHKRQKISSANCKGMIVTFMYMSIPALLAVTHDVAQFEADLLRQFNFPINTKNNGGPTPVKVHVPGRGLVKLEDLPDMHSRPAMDSGGWSLIPVMVLKGVLRSWGVPFKSFRTKRKNELVELIKQHMAGHNVPAASQVTVAMSGIARQWTPDFVKEATLPQLQLYYYQQSGKQAKMDVESLRQSVLDHLETPFEHSISRSDSPAASTPAPSTSATPADRSRRRPQRKSPQALAPARPAIFTSQPHSSDRTSCETAAAEGGLHHTSSSNSMTATVACTSDSSSSSSNNIVSAGSGRRRRRLPKQCHNPTRRTRSDGIQVAGRAYMQTNALHQTLSGSC